jgi:hypothetical protein
MAALQCVLAHAAGLAFRIAMRQEASSVCNVLYEQLAAQSALAPSDFGTVREVVFQLMEREPATTDNAESIWARVVFALRDAGCDVGHLTDWLWVSYTGWCTPTSRFECLRRPGDARPNRCRRLNEWRKRSALQMLHSEWKCDLQRKK